MFKLLVIDSTTFAPVLHWKLFVDVFSFQKDASRVFEQFLHLIVSHGIPSLANAFSNTFSTCAFGGHEIFE